MKTKTTTDTVEKEFDKKLMLLIQELTCFDYFSIPLKDIKRLENRASDRLKSFIKAQIDKAVREERKKHICKIGGDLLRN